MENKNKSNVLDIVKTLVEQISKNYSVESVYLYGSCSYGSPGNESDIDVAVILNEFIDNAKDFDIFRIGQKIDLDLEVVAFTNDDFVSDASDLIVEIKTKGEKVA